MAIRFPWDSDAAAVVPPLPPPEPRSRARPSGAAAGPGRSRDGAIGSDGSSGTWWLYHHLTIAGPADAVAAFAAAARGAGVTPWRLDFAMLEEDIFNLAASQPAAASQPDHCRMPHPGTAVPRAGRAAAGQGRRAGGSQSGLPVRSARAAAGAGRHSRSWPDAPGGPGLAGGPLGRDRPAAPGHPAAAPEARPAFAEGPLR